MLGTSKAFRAPPEAPVFEPSAKEFTDPLAYIARIRPVAEKSGICKIRPPPDWQPPFAIDVDNFRFTPRVQCLRELEATTRVTLNFLEKLTKFWEFQGAPLKIPHVDRKLLDLHALFKIVHGEGGFDKVSREKKWPKIAYTLGYIGNPGNILRHHYEKLLFPYEVFENSLKLCNQKPKKDDPRPKQDDTDKGRGSSASHSLGGRCAGRMSRSVPKDEGIDYHANSELRKLQFFGAGPKAAIPVLAKDESDGKPESRWKMRDRGSGKPKYMESDACQICEKSDNETQLLLCDGCNEFVHMYCLVPPLIEAPKMEWRCPKCIAKECNAPREAYGFAQSKKTYTLHEFGEMADKFKSDYFRMPVHEVPHSVTEREFWRLVSSIEDDVTVQYGADIHALTNGSGFPTDTTSSDPAVMEYVKSGWNLNNLPIQEESVLRWVTGDVSGMKVPWCYVGMCFASFAWHIEDHWTYSINYLHWGEPKTWYGAPSEFAERLEKEMKGCAPELFEQAPDLLHQLTTLMNPNVLMERGIPIVRTNQNAGEFIVTFPRSYHAGFNQGYNFAEAVNFCPADWLPYGRACVESYKLVRRQCVFSHEELVCKMAADPDRLNLQLAIETHQELLKIVTSEKQQRTGLHDKGCNDSEREAFELVPDDERICAFCKTTCFLSAVTCPCKPGVLVCIAHAQDLCGCSPSKMCLRYRYTLEELNVILSRLNNRAHSHDIWSQKASSALTVANDFKLPLADFKDLLREWTEKQLPPSPLVQQLTSTVKEAETCTSEAQPFLQCRATVGASREAKLNGRPTYLKLHELHARMSQLRCHVKETATIADLLRRATSLRGQIQFMTSDDAVLTQPESSIGKLEKLEADMLAIGITLPESEQLEQVILQAKWLMTVKPLLSGCHESHAKAFGNLAALRQVLARGVSLGSSPAMNKATNCIQRLVAKSELCEEKALTYLESKTKSKLEEIEAFVKDCQALPIDMQHVPALLKVVHEARAWNMRAAEPHPFVSSLKALIVEGQCMPVHLALLPRLEASVQNAQAWKEKASRAFVGKHSKVKLLEVLQPRKDLRAKLACVSTQPGVDCDEKPVLVAVKIEEQDSKSVTAAYADLERKEIDGMLQLRSLNKMRQSDLRSEAIASDSGVHLSHHPDHVLVGASQCALCLAHLGGSTVDTEQCGMFPEKDSGSIACKAGTARADHKTCCSSVSSNGSRCRVLCSLCMRTKRPRLDSVLKQLLLPLHALKPVRVPEGEALSSLVGRALSWQKRAQRWLADSSGDFDRDELERLVVEGNLIEMDLPEQDTLWEAFCQRSSASEQQQPPLLSESTALVEHRLCPADADGSVVCTDAHELLKRKGDSQECISEESSCSSTSEGCKRVKLECPDESELNQLQAAHTLAATCH